MRERRAMITLATALSMLAWGGTGAYPKYDGEAKSKPSDAENASKARTGTMDKNAQANADAQSGTLSQVEGPDVTQTGMYKRLLSLGTEGTTNAYNQARAKRATAANRAGFGYTSPIANTDQATVDQLEARDLGNLPRETAQDVMPYSMQAAGMRGQNIGTYNKSGDNSLNTWGDLEKARAQRRAAMFGQIAKLGMTAATTFIPHGGGGGDDGE